MIEQAAGIKMKRTYNLAAPTGLKGRGVMFPRPEKFLAGLLVFDFARGWRKPTTGSMMST